MKAQMAKRILLPLLAAWMCAGTFGGTVLAVEHGGGSHVQEPAAAVSGQQQSSSAHGTEDAAAHGAKDAHAKGGHGSGQHVAPMVTKEKLLDLLWRTMNFAVLLIVLVKFLGKPVTEALSSRRRNIEEELKNLQSKRDEAERSYKEFEARLAGMEEEVALIVSRAAALAADEKSRILAEAEDAAKEIRRQAEAAVQAALAAAQKSLREEAAEQAAAMAEQLIVKNLTPKDQVLIIEQYLEKAGRVQ